ncbi:hypothetical protein AA313_de0208215 [Arthrobotrys entomopaga]|nr:hypothetical protein AA313_de0208215 [Arthrobotrys entomopaga]
MRRACHKAREKAWDLELVTWNMWHPAAAQSTSHQIASRKYDMITAYWPVFPAKRSILAQSERPSVIPESAFLWSQCSDLSSFNQAIEKQTHPKTPYRIESSAGARHLNTPSMYSRICP